jgi:hypothetical protein
MAQRKNKERKQKLLKYKKSKVMSESKAPEMRPFRQVPNWSSTEKFDINGEELGALYNFFNIFAPAYTAFQQVFARGYKSGKVTVSYEDLEGNPIHNDEIEQFTQKLNEHFQAENAKKEGKVIDGDVPSQNAKIVSFTGERLTKEQVDSTLPLED